MARLLIALFCLLQGRHVDGQAVTVPAVTVPPTLDPIFPDVTDTACSPGSYCTTGVGITTPPLRGLCVSQGFTGNVSHGQQCWDACNTNHSLDSFFPVANPAVTADVAEQKAIAMMVAQLRAGSRYSSCPGSQSSYGQSECGVGERCTPPGLTWGRGMCITITDAATQTQANSCLDMCDSSIPIATYKAPGKQAGTLSTVQAVQNGRDPSGLTTCPGVTVWVWLWFPILLCCIIGCCAASYVGYNFYKSRLKPQQRYREPINDQEQRYGEQAYVQDQSPPYDNYQDQENQMAPPQTMDFQGDDAGPMPVFEPQTQYDQPQFAAEAPYVAPFVEEKAYEGAYQGNIFDQPNLMGGLAPLTVAAPTSAYTMPMAGSSYLTSGAQHMTQYPAAQSMSLQQPMYMPSYGGSSVQPMTTMAPTYGAPTRASATVAPTYGAYGAYGAYPGTTSMRIG